MKLLDIVDQVFTTTSTNEFNIMLRLCIGQEDFIFKYTCAHKTSDGFYIDGIGYGNFLTADCINNYTYKPSFYDGLVVYILPQKWSKQYEI